MKQEEIQKELDAVQYTGGEVIVKIKKGTEYTLDPLPGEKENLSPNWWKLTVPEEELESVLMKLKKLDSVLVIQPNYTYHTLEAEKGQDPGYTKQWGLSNAGTITYTDLEGRKVTGVSNMDISYEKAIGEKQGTRQVIVAVIDTGIDYKHEDLKQNMWRNKKEIPGNGIDDDGNGYVDDVYGWDFYHNDKTVCAYDSTGQAKSSDNDNHGTHCAGTIAAVKGNGLGIEGVASSVPVKIMAIKALGGKKNNTTTAKLIRSISYAKQMGASIVNASWGGSIAKKSEDVALKTAIRESGMLFVAAAGNDGSNNDERKCYPACYSDLDNVIAVGAIDANGKLSSFSNYGKSVDIVAPGSRIYSTKVGGYAYMSGTSMAAPMVSGVAAMLYSVKSGLYPKTVKALLLTSYKPIATVDQNKIANAGVIDAYNAVTNTHMLETDREAPKITKLHSNYKGYVSVRAKDTGGAGVCSIRAAYGKKKAAYFRKGAKGTRIPKNIFRVKKTGTYTIYVRDNAGNFAMKRIRVVVDTTPPKIEMALSKNKLEIKVTDKGTKVSKVRYAYGDKKASYFQKGAKGNKLTLSKGKAKLKVRKGVITIYAIDKAGNEKVQVVDVYL